MHGFVVVRDDNVNEDKARVGTKHGRRGVLGVRAGQREKQESEKKER
jgi:hypothetical protein